MSKRPIAWSSVAIKLRIAMAQVVGAAVEVHVNQTAARHVPEQIAFAPVNHQSTPASCQNRVLSGVQNSSDRRRKSALES